MENKERIEKMIDEALNSLEGAGRAVPQPFLLTRINAKLNKPKESTWEKAAGFIASPSVVIAGLCLIIAVNVLVITSNRANDNDTITVVNQQSLPTDEFSTTTASLTEI